MTLADLFAAPTEFKLGDETFLVSRPNLLQEGLYQRWLEQVAFDAINRRTYQSDDEKLKSIRMHDLDCAAGTFEWGSEISMRRIQTRKGLEKLLVILCRDQGLDEAKSAKLVEQEGLALIQVFKDRVESEAAGGEKKDLAETLSRLGSPSAFLLSVLLTHPLICRSNPSPGSPTPS